MRVWAEELGVGWISRVLVLVVDLVLGEVGWCVRMVRGNDGLRVVVEVEGVD